MLLAARCVVGCAELTVGVRAPAVNVATGQRTGVLACDGNLIDCEKVRNGLWIALSGTLGATPQLSAIVFTPAPSASHCVGGTSELIADSDLRCALEFANALNRRSADTGAPAVDRAGLGNCAGLPVFGRDARDRRKVGHTTGRHPTRQISRATAAGSFETKLSELVRPEAPHVTFVGHQARVAVAARKTHDWGIERKRNALFVPVSAAAPLINDRAACDALGVVTGAQQQAG